MSVYSQLYEGKAKILYATDNPEVLLADFKDDATAFNAQKRGSIIDKGKINCTISSQLFQQLEIYGIKTHYIDSPNPHQMRVKAVKIVPIEVVIRNIAAGSLSVQTGLPVGTVLKQPLVEFYYKNDQLGDPLLTRDRLFLLELATPEQVDTIHNLALQVNEFLRGFWQQCGITLVDFKLEFGLDSQQQILLADEISPDTCRLWDTAEADPNLRVMDKDRFRRDLGNVENAYQEVLQRVLQAVESKT
ncbi:phosphoribosylaminoimidazolesuccinocarboxamide synthase [Nodularia spumigena CS-584]|jgi:phosphoribosylaminoimidazole-succinocarboxamide synthase|uniref:Phosphoribosylaminoimidazole-succinocarboxamide synthase n=2 Tax=Nodularia spumigena TaxID=70799 RepID=A0A2S0Q723_NODSP|nr:phosphoribosylaminoimidazolesuccinocarboxamide synthase [Nodularia spumigena]AVZ30249.1 phosphoribosylaminoimidazole-succinocarboxamide synthase [Nodularia spumigena UHCC 0039]EAW45105.1 phosphoribosylaminoimidazole-succinocarboxamide synthase [Nodularia spumigena CCY9414]MDB9384207.1 phosphoribosylaminoimidazolesuccinocarboxamide synthase [Nodularia spumigena CS-584]MEA5525601.1 phosphoribosylaminoimidazolesuccinocarboxamide synthase [Nodularia spumigena UHCC 0143]MEA5556446.1 phosphoribos